MIAIDTNVLLRYLLDDNAKQSKKASAIITGSDNVLITDVVLTETIWTLKGKKYKLGQTVWRALSDYTKAKSIKVGNKRKEADFPDALIVNKAQYVANKLNDELDGVYTFDVASQEIPGTREP